MTDAYSIAEARAFEDALSPALTILDDRRDSSVYSFDLRTKPPSTVRIAVLWDADRDRRIVAVLAAMAIKDRSLLANVAGVAEQGGRIDWYCTSQALAESTTRCLAKAAADTLYRDAWSVNKPKILPQTGGLVDWAALDEKHPLLALAKGFQLGVNKGGAL